MSQPGIADRLDGLGRQLAAENGDRGARSPRRRPPALSMDSPGSASRAIQRRGQSLEMNMSLSLSPRSHRAHSTEDRRLTEIMANASKLTFEDGMPFHGVRTADLQRIGDLGTGTCGHVVKMRHPMSGREMAVKQMRKSGVAEENQRIHMDLEVVLKCSDCPNIVHCYGYFVTDSEVWICMELMDTCLDKLQKARGRRPIPEDILGSICYAVVKALHYLKSKHRVIHRDVKPSNILLDKNGCVKLCDFGISGRLVDSLAKTRSAGVAGYTAPERIDPPNGYLYDIRADVWSLGITLVELATGRFPYANCTTDFELFTKVVQEQPPRLDRTQFTEQFCDFVSLCLTKDYKHRPKYERLLQHDFIKRHERIRVDVTQLFHGL